MRKVTMSYTLITADGRIKTFHIKSVAELYQRLDGGVIVTRMIIEDDLVVDAQSQEI